MEGGRGSSFKNSACDLAPFEARSFHHLMLSLYCITLRDKPLSTLSTEVYKNALSSSRGYFEWKESCLRHSFFFIIALFLSVSLLLDLYYKEWSNTCSRLITRSRTRNRKTVTQNGEFLFRLWIKCCLLPPPFLSLSLSFSNGDFLSDQGDAVSINFQRNNVQVTFASYKVLLLASFICSFSIFGSKQFLIKIPLNISSVCRVNECSYKEKVAKLTDENTSRLLSPHLHHLPSPSPPPLIQVSTVYWGRLLADRKQRNTD